MDPELLCYIALSIQIVQFLESAENRIGARDTMSEEAMLDLLLPLFEGWVCCHDDSPYAYD